MEKEDLKKKVEEDNNQSEEEFLDTKQEVHKDEEKKLDDKEQEKEISPEEEIENLKDKLARTFAEMENQRRRFEKEKDDAFEYGGFSFAKESLNLLDNLERSKASLENDDKLKNTETLKKVIEHLDIVNKDIISIFKKNNIEQIDTINKKLDPNFHQAMMEVEDDAKEPGTIVQEIQTGFMMKDRLLRPALVAVSKKPDNSEKKDKIVKNDEKNNKN